MQDPALDGCVLRLRWHRRGTDRETCHQRSLPCSSSWVSQDR